MQKSTDPNAAFGQAPPEAPNGSPVAGDADAVEKTTYTVGKGTDDRAQRAPAAADPEDVERDLSLF